VETHQQTHYRLKERPMKFTLETTLPDLGAALEGGFFAGRFTDDGKSFSLIVSPKAEGENKPAIWIPKYKAVPGALSYVDGQANTKAMADEGSALAKWALKLHINDFDDWYLPAQDEAEILYRNLKPTTRENYCWARSGINLSAIPPTRPNTRTFPAQTPVAAFQKGGSEAFEEEAYWTSTQHVSASDSAWYQGFTNGSQSCSYTDGKLRARAVRRLEIL
jgi:hypothetical protein